VPVGDVQSVLGYVLAAWALCLVAYLLFALIFRRRRGGL
jgi:hypothetical protein